MSASAKPSEPRPRRWRAALVALALLLAAVPVGAQTGGGSTMLGRLLESLVPGLSVQGLRGPLAARPGFARLTLSDADGVWLEVEEASVDWSMAALLRRQLHIEDMVAARILVHRLPGGDAPPPAADAPPGQVLPALPSLPVALRVDRLAIERVELASPVLGEAVALRAAGRLRLDAEGLDLDLDTVIEGGALLNLEATLRPATGRLAARAVLRGEPGGTLSRVMGLGDRPLALDITLDGPADGAALALRASAGPGVAAELSGTIAAPDTVRIGAVLTGRVDASGLLDGPLAPLAGPVELAVDAGRMADGLVELRRLRVAGAAGTLEGAGRLDMAGGRTALGLRATLAGSDVFAALLPEGIAGWDAVAAEAEVTGPLATPRLALTVAPEGFRSDIAPLAALLGPAPRLALRAAAPDSIEALTLAGAAVQAEVRGRLGDTLDLTFAAEVAALPEAIPGLAGALRLQGTAAGPARDPTITVEAQSDRLEAAGRVVEALALSARIATPASRPAVEARATGRFESLPLSLELRGTPEDAGWLRLHAAEASFGPARLTTAGRVQPAGLLAEGEARLDVPDLAPFSALAGQPLAGAVTLEARGAAPEGRQTIALRLAVPRLAAAGVQGRDITATAEGSLAALELALAGTVNEVAAEARGRLTEAEGTRRLDLAALRATAAGETIRLAAPARVTLRPDGGVEIGAASFALPRSGTLRAEGRWGPERADLRATLAALDLAGLAAFAPGLAPAGTVSGEARITGPVAAPEITATLRGAALRSGASPGLPPGEVRLELRRTAEGLLTAQAEARVGPQNRLSASARFPRGPGAEKPFEARLDGGLDLGPLTAPFLAAGADRVTGRLALALRATGTPTAPVLGGEARLSGGTYRNAPLGVAITNVAGTLRPDGPRLRADITGRTVGEGRLALAGTIEPLAPYLPLDLVLTATNAQPVYSTLLRATLDAELRLAGLLGTGATLSGPVRVRRADIRIPERLGGAVRSLEPVIEIGSPPGRAPRLAPLRLPAAAEGGAGGPPIALAIVVEAPRAVFVRGRGLDAELGGQLAVGGNIAAPEINGALELRRGDLTIAGRRLAFERGRLAWDGALLPYLTLRAASQAGAYAVAVEVNGPPTAPELVFTSTPELPQDEVLARLLFDRPLGDLSPLEIAQIAAAAAGTAGLPGGGGAGVLDTVREGLGLDRLAVGSGRDRTARATPGEEPLGPTLEAGRYVADGIYVGVRQGTEPGSSRVGVRVDLTPQLRLEAETGDREAGERVGVSWEWQWGR